jgi:hypothetical protein
VLEIYFFCLKRYDGDGGVSFRGYVTCHILTSYTGNCTQNASLTWLLIIISASLCTRTDAYKGKYGQNSNYIASDGFVNAAMASLISQKSRNLTPAKWLSPSQEGLGLLELGSTLRISPKKLSLVNKLKEYVQCRSDLQSVLRALFHAFIPRTTARDVATQCRCEDHSSRNTSRRKSQFMFHRHTSEM